MRIKVTNEDGHCKERLVRDRWQDIFYMKVTRLYIEDVGTLPKGFVLAKYYVDSDAYLYVIWPLVPAVRLADWIRRLWFFIPRHLYRRGYLDKAENEECPWFWFSRIRFKSWRKQ